MADAPRRLALVDTDVLSFIFNRDPIRGVRYEAILADHQVIVPFIAVAEMRRGAYLAGWGAARRGKLESFLSDYRLAFPDDTACDIWASISASARKTGRNIAPQDTWIAALALSARLPLVTHNASDFRHIPMLEVVTA